MKRIRILSAIAMLLLVPMLVYYPYEAISWQLEISFLDMERWSRNSTWVDEGIDIPMTTRIVFFTVWFVPTLMGLSAYLIGFSALILVWQGEVFKTRLARRIVWMGCLITGSAALSVLAGSVSPMIRSWHNAEGPLPLRFWYSSGNLGMVYCGLAFVFLGLVMREAIRIARENEEFV